jgi:hypothetical protein
VLNDRFREFLDSLPQATPRSCLEPYKELIQELRRRKRPYREIVHVLAEKCGIPVSHRTLHEFVHRHLSRRRVSAEKCVEPRAANKIASRDRSESRPATYTEVRERIEALKRKPATGPHQPKTFQFDGTEPLRLQLGKT